MIERKKGKKISKSKNIKKGLIKTSDILDSKSYPSSFRRLSSGQYREYRFGKPTDYYYRKVKYKGKYQLIPEPIMKEVDKWKLLQKKSKTLEAKYETAKRMRDAGFWNRSDPVRISQERRKVQREMSDIQIFVEKAGYDFHALI